MPWSAVATVRWPTQATRVERAPHGIGTRERIALRRYEKLTLPLRGFLFATAMNGVVTPSVWPSETGYVDVANPRIGQLQLNRRVRAGAQDRGAARGASEQRDHV